MNWELVRMIVMLIFMAYVLWIIVPVYETRNNCTAYCLQMYGQPPDNTFYNLSHYNLSAQMSSVLS